MKNGQQLIDLPLDSGTLSNLTKILRKCYGTPSAPTSMDPVDILVLTMLSQNTTDTNRDRAFDCLKEHYPSWDSLLRAPAQEIEKSIAVAGLAPQKAPRIFPHCHAYAINQDNGSDY